MNYRVIFFDHGGNVYSEDTFDAENDIAAIIDARHIFATTIGMGYEIQRSGAHIHTELFVPPPKMDGAPPARYAVHFLDGEKRLVASEKIVADQDQDALAIAMTLFDACCDVCQSYQLWKDNVLILPKRSGNIEPKLIQLRDYARSVVIDRELAMRDSSTAIAQSRRLLERLEELGGA